MAYLDPSSSAQIVDYQEPSSNWGNVFKSIGGFLPGAANIFSLFGQKNPYNPMMDYMGRFQNQLDPYLKAGGQGLNAWQRQLGMLTDNPTGLEDSILSKYHGSDAENYQMNQMQRASQNAAAAGGYLGSPQEQEELMQKAQAIASQGQQQYLQNAMQPYEFGVQGLQSLANLGFSSVDELRQYLSDMANGAGASAQWQNQNLGQLLGTFAGLAGPVASLSGLI